VSSLYLLTFAEFTYEFPPEVSATAVPFFPSLVTVIMSLGTLLFGRLFQSTHPCSPTTLTQPQGSRVISEAVMMMPCPIFSRFFPYCPPAFYAACGCFSRGWFVKKYPYSWCGPLPPPPNKSAQYYFSTAFSKNRMPPPPRSGFSRLLFYLPPPFRLRPSTRSCFSEASRPIRFFPKHIVLSPLVASVILPKVIPLFLLFPSLVSKSGRRPLFGNGFRALKFPPAFASDFFPTISQGFA